MTPISWRAAQFDVPLQLPPGTVGSIGDLGIAVGTNRNCFGSPETDCNGNTTGFQARAKGIPFSQFDYDSHAMQEFPLQGPPEISLQRRVITQNAPLTGALSNPQRTCQLQGLYPAGVTVLAGYAFNEWLDLDPELIIRTPDGDPQGVRNYRGGRWGAFTAFNALCIFAGDSDECTGVMTSYAGMPAELSRNLTPEVPGVLGMFEPDRLPTAEVYPLNDSGSLFATQTRGNHFVALDRDNRELITIAGEFAILDGSGAVLTVIDTQMANPFFLAIDTSSQRLLASDRRIVQVYGTEGLVSRIYYDSGTNQGTITAARFLAAGDLLICGASVQV